MTNKLCCRLLRRRPAISRRIQLGLILAAIGLLTGLPRAVAGDAPAWMHAQVNAPLPAHDEKTDAVLLYSETNVTVISADKIKTTVREAYKILRPNGREHGTVAVYFNPTRKIKSLHGWCIPAQGKDYEVKDKDAVDRSISGSGELVDDVKVRVLTIPAPEPGNIVGYEYEVEERPFFLQDLWHFQEHDPVRESNYALQLPAGWEFKATWLNHPEEKATDAGNNLWQWTVSDVKEIRYEPAMPPFRGVAGQMFVTYFPPGGKAVNGFADWNDLGNWVNQLMAGRMDASPEIKQQVATITAGKSTQLEKMQAIAQFVQHDIRYVAIELGIGGWQPHPASEVFSHRYGDCKDKATLTRSMLHEIGIESFQVVINSNRGVVTRGTPANNFGFNHAILAVRLPENFSDPALVATIQHPKLGRLLYFDPTDDITPFGQIRGALQDNYALLVTTDGGELIPLPQQPSAMNSVQRTAKLTLDTAGMLKGEVKEVRLGGRARSERSALMKASKDVDRIKPIETLLSNSLPSFRITHATVTNLEHTDQPFGFDYTFEADSYAKNAGGLLLVRPRVLGNKAFNFFENKEPRKFPFEFDGPARDTDTFEIALPAGYEVDDMPPAVDADYSFASYHSKTEVSGGVIRYTRTYELKELSVPVERADELRRFDRTITGDERNTVVLKAVSAKSP
jgi:predicted transglutaminase-like cysteine proteinase